VEELGIPYYIQSEHRGTDQNASEGAVVICDGTVATTRIDNVATVEENNCSLSNSNDEVYAHVHLKDSSTLQIAILQISNLTNSMN
jgi:hypothetical protein